MRLLGALAVLILAGCETMSDREWRLAGRGLTEDDLTAPPNDNEIRARIVNDVRTTWIPDAELDRGLASCPAVRFDGSQAMCIQHEDPVPMKTFAIRSDSPDRQHPVQETAFFCPEHSAYWYHYEGGDRRKNVWMGPRKIRLQRRAEPKEEQ